VREGIICDVLANYTCVAPRFVRDACARDAAARATREREARERNTREREAREREGKKEKGGKRERAGSETKQAAGKSRRTDGGKATKQEEQKEISCSSSSFSSFSSEVIKRKACLIAQHFARKLAEEQVEMYNYRCRYIRETHTHSHSPPPPHTHSISHGS
jgi:hypothetical protein